MSSYQYIIGVPDNRQFDVKESGFKVGDKYLYRRYPTVTIDGIVYYVDLAGYIPTLKQVKYPMPLTTGCIFNTDPINSTSNHEGRVRLMSADKDKLVSASGVDKLSIVKSYDNYDDQPFMSMYDELTIMELKRLPEPASSCSIM